MAGPKWNIPSGAAAKVALVDSTMRLTGLPASMMFANPVAGFSHFGTLPAWCLLVESPSGRRAIFDLGAPADLDTFAPVWRRSLADSGLGHQFQVEKDVAQVLQDHGVAPAEVGSIIWRSVALPNSRGCVLVRMFRMS